MLKELYKEHPLYYYNHYSCRVRIENELIRIIKGSDPYPTRQAYWISAEMEIHTQNLDEKIRKLDTQNIKGSRKERNLLIIQVP